MCNFVNNLCASFSLLCQNWHADLEFACKFCFLVYVVFFVPTQWESHHKASPLTIIVDYELGVAG